MDEMELKHLNKSDMKAVVAEIKKATAEWTCNAQFTVFDNRHIIEVKFTGLTTGVAFREMQHTIRVLKLDFLIYEGKMYIYC